mmetsp:Transcript_26014/g.40707  ORF Transcript_26014/g.40707 Transcript_26014/m.40707 type:complete len:301 (-) Transcript_26014:67-969(-)
MAGAFYGVVINSLDSGKVHHEQGGGFWRNESGPLEERIAKITNSMAKTGATAVNTGDLSDGPPSKPPLVKQKNFKSIDQIKDHANRTGTISQGSAITNAVPKPTLQQKEQKLSAEAIPKADRSQEAESAKKPEEPQQKQDEPLKREAAAVVQDPADEARKLARQLRGVNPDKKQLYQGLSFRCDKETEIDIEKVNDDFCDCEDASDEPGTSACENGHFFCSGSDGISVASSRVNDGICDCCDGSDEWGNAELMCANTCGAQSQAIGKHPGGQHRAQGGLKTTDSLFNKKLKQNQDGSKAK